ncbi:MAG: CpaF family protein [Oligoflexia bacterium]|nr:CpaF family protein [Oligoflexia bacterium]
MEQPKEQLKDNTNPIKQFNKKNGLWKLLDELSIKKGITEITINSPNNTFVEKEGRFFLLDIKLSEQEIFEFTKEIASFNNKKCDQNNPILDGNLPDGSRINIIHPPFVKPTPVITIRKYLSHILSFKDSPSIFGLNEKWITFIRAAIKGKLNMIVCGGTGAGKTTMLNLLLQEIPKEERVITIEDTRELNFKIPNLVHLVAGAGSGSDVKSGITLSIRDLVKNTLRMRPDRIIIGEVRGGEIFDLLQAMNTGHDGSMASIHASSPAECLTRMNTIYMLAGYDIPMRAIKGQISQAINFLVQISRNKEGERIVSEIAEITGMEGENILMQVLARYENGQLISTGLVPHCMRKLEHGGLKRDFFNSL